MMDAKQWLCWTAGLLFCLSSCNSEPVKDPSGSEEAAMKAEAVDSSAVADSKDSGEVETDATFERTSYGYEGRGWYKRLKGTIGNLPVTVHLVAQANLASPFDSLPEALIRGYYTYDKYQEPIPLFQYQPDQEALKDLLVLYEYYSDVSQNQWRLSLGPDGNGYFEGQGTWHAADGENTLGIQLEEEQLVDTEPLEVHWLSDRQSTTLAKERRVDALLNLSMLFPVISEDLNADIAYGIIWRIIPAFADADLAERAGSPRAVLRGLHEQFFAAHGEEIDLLKKEPRLLESSFMDQRMSVVWNGDMHLSLAVERYKSINGAQVHPQTQFVNIDLSDWQGIFLEDIFKPGYEAPLEQALQQAAQRAFSRDPNGDVAESEKAGIVDNYAITSKGIWFSYEPYFFAAFGPEEYKLFVTFEQLAAFVQPQWLALAGI